MVSYAEYYGAVFPAEADVATGEVYGPTGAEYTGTLSGGGGPTAEEIATAVWSNTNGAALIRRETERVQGIRDWGVFGNAPLFEPAVSDNSMATWGTPVYDGTTRRLYYTAGNGSGSYLIRHIALDSAGLPTGSPTTVLTGGASYDAAGAFLPVVERESTTLHMFYCGMPSLATNQNICYATASTSDPLTWTKQGVAIAYSDLPAYLHSGAEPTGLIKFGSTYYMYLCSTHGGAAAALGASTMDRRAAVATASSLSGPWTITPLLCESTAESFQEPWIYQISPSVFRASSSATALFYMISASGGVNTDYQQLELHESPTPMFAREYTRHIGTILVPRDEGAGFPDWEIDVVGTLSDDISKNSRSCTSGALWLYFGGKSHSDGLWKMGLSKQASVVKALRPPIQTRCHRYGTQLPLRAANLWEEEQTATLLLSTTIATVTSQTVFTLTAGVSVNDAYNDQVVIITDASGRTVKGRAVVSDYVGSTRTLTLSAATSFTIAAGDSIRIDASGSASSGSLTVGQQAQLDAIEAKTALLTIGSRPSVVSPVSAGGTITIIRDTDYLSAVSSALEIDIEDVGGVVATRMNAANSLRFGAGRTAKAEEFAGTVTSVVDNGDDTTTITIEIDRADTADLPVSDEYTYQIRRADNSDPVKLVVEVTGQLCLTEDHVD